MWLDSISFDDLYPFRFGNLVSEVIEALVSIIYNFFFLIVLNVQVLYFYSKSCPKAHLARRTRGKYPWLSRMELDIYYSVFITFLAKLQYF